MALLYDGFTFNALSWLEGLGFCELGGAADFIDGGKGISVDGVLPLNPHGGQLSAGRTHGYGFVREAVLQLRGQAPGVQVADAKVAVVTPAVACRPARCSSGPASEEHPEHPYPIRSGVVMDRPLEASAFSRSHSSPSFPPPAPCSPTGEPTS